MNKDVETTDTWKPMTLSVSGYEVRPGPIPFPDVNKTREGWLAALQLKQIDMRYARFGISSYRRFARNK